MTIAKDPKAQASRPGETVAAQQGAVAPAKVPQSQDTAPKAKSKARRAASTLLLPQSIFMAKDQGVKSVRNIREALAAAREVRERRRANTGLPAMTARVTDAEGLVHDIALEQDPGARFEQLYRVYGWDAESHAAQIRAARRTKYAAMVMSIVSFVLALCMMGATSMRWLALLMLPVSLLVFSAGLAFTFRWALVEFQYTKRSLVTYKTFLAQEDFFRWIFF